MSDIVDNGLIGASSHRIQFILQNAERHRLGCYLERRQWQLKQFRIGYREDWSKHELLFVLKHKYSALIRLRKRNPGATGTLIIPMVRAAYEAEIAA